MRPSIIPVALVAFSFAPFATSTALAQPQSGPRRAPQSCGQEAGSADYGDIAVGARVVVQRHRYVEGDPNWDAQMARFLGRPATVERLSGVDEQGCPGVRVDIDGGRWFWRVRDLNVGLAHPRREPRRRAASVPQACGMNEATVSYGRYRIGSTIVLGRHRPVDGDTNWTPEMNPFVGRTARIVELAGVDSTGCPGVRVDIDGREWFWRIRDSRTSGGASPISYRPGLASDHGRPQSAAIPGADTDPRMPQACGLTDETVQWGPVRVGAEIVLGRHRDVDGEPNWAPEMEQFVGRPARVTELVGVDEQGCPLVRVNVDEGDFFWRIRDASLPAPPPGAAPAAPAPSGPDAATTPAAPPPQAAPSTP